MSTITHYIADTILTLKFKICPGQKKKREKTVESFKLLDGDFDYSIV